MSDEVIILAEEDINDVVILADESSFKALTLELAFNELLLAHVVRVNTDQGFVENYDCFSTEVQELLLEDEYDDAKLIITPNQGAKVGKMYTVKPTDGSGDGVMDRNSEKTRVNKAGLIETLPANLLLPDYTDGGCGVIKPEVQSTNLFLNSVFDGGSSPSTPPTSWSRFGTGGSMDFFDSRFLSGSKIEFTTTSDREFLNQNVNVISGLDYIISYELEVISNLDLSLFNLFVSNSFRLVSVFKVDGVIVPFTTILPVGKYNVSSMFTSSITASTQIRCGIGINESATANIIVDLPQIEQSSESSSYIPTTNSIVTRLKDTTSFPVPVGTTEIIETRSGVEQPPITVIPATYELPEANINKVIMK